MSTTTAVRAVPRAVVDVSLRAARVPLDVAGRVTGQSGNEEWPPAVAFDTFQANVESVLGALLKDEELQDRGRVQHARVAQLRHAADLRAVADQQRLQADRTLEQREQQVERVRQEAERRAEQREQEVQQHAEQRRTEVRQRTAKKAAAAHEVQQAQKKAQTQQERRARQQSLEREAEAVDAAKSAVEARETTARVTDAIEGSRAARKSH